MVQTKKENKQSKEVKPIVSKSSKPKETKTETFLRIAKPRVERILKSFRVLGNCSKRNNYEYSQEQIDKMFEKIYASLEITMNKFTPSKKESESFDF